MTGLMQRLSCGLWLIALVGLVSLQPGWAASTLCDRAAQTAARETGVPLRVMLAVTRVETGRGRAGAQPEPWPWALNIGGDGSWHDTADTALLAAQQAIATGKRNIDIGCFQLNYRWHGHGFASLDAMMEPLSNARYAAQFLRDLHRELGDWTRAAGAYHSRNPEHAARYLARYHDIYAALSAPPARTPPAGPSALSRAARPTVFHARGGSLSALAHPMQGGGIPPLWERH